MWQPYDKGRQHIREMAEDRHRTEFLCRLVSDEARHGLMSDEELRRVALLAGRREVVKRFDLEEQRWIDQLKKRFQ